MLQNISNKHKLGPNFFFLNEFHFVLRRLSLLNGKILFINTVPVRDDQDVSFATRVLSLKYDHLYIVKHWFSGALTNSKIIRARYSWYNGTLSNFYTWPHLVFLLNAKQNAVCLNELKFYQIPTTAIVTLQEYLLNQQTIKYPIFSDKPTLFSTVYYYNKYVLNLMQLFKNRTKC